MADPLEPPDGGGRQGLRIETRNVGKGFSSGTYKASDLADWLATTDVLCLQETAAASSELDMSALAAGVGVVYVGNHNVGVAFKVNEQAVITCLEIKSRIVAVLLRVHGGGVWVASIYGHNIVAGGPNKAMRAMVHDVDELLASWSRRAMRFCVAGDLNSAVAMSDFSVMTNHRVAQLDDELSLARACARAGAVDMAHRWASLEDGDEDGAPAAAPHTFSYRTGGDLAEVRTSRIDFIFLDEVSAALATEVATYRSPRPGVHGHVAVAVPFAQGEMPKPAPRVGPAWPAGGAGRQWTPREVSSYRRALPEPPSLTVAEAGPALADEGLDDRRQQAMADIDAAAEALTQAILTAGVRIWGQRRPAVDRDRQAYQRQLQAWCHAREVEETLEWLARAQEVGGGNVDRHFVSAERLEMMRAATCQTPFPISPMDHLAHGRHIACLEDAGSGRRAAAQKERWLNRCAEVRRAATWWKEHRRQQGRALRRLITTQKRTRKRRAWNQAVRAVAGGPMGRGPPPFIWSEQKRKLVDGAAVGTVMDDYGSRRYAAAGTDGPERHPLLFSEVLPLERDNGATWEQVWAESTGPVHHKEVVAAIGRLNQKAAPGLDLIPAQAVSALPTAWVEALATIIEASRRWRHVPPAWSDTVMTPIPKSGKAGALLEMDSVRLIGVVSAISKVAQIVLLRRIEVAINDHRVLDPSR